MSKTFHPLTYIKCILGNMWDERLSNGKILLFVGYITNGDVMGSNAVLMDDDGVIFTTSIKEEEFEVCK